MSGSCLVIGASGQVGGAVCSAFADREVFAAMRNPRHDGELAVDLTDLDTIDAALEGSRPEVIVIAGAWTWVDGAEEQPDVCMATNVEGPAHIARWAAANDASVVYYSTDHVFDGTREFHEVGDPVNPLNVYAQSKVAGERELAKITDRHLIIRTAWVYGPDEREKNFAIRLVKALESGEPVRVPSDQWGTPTYAPDLARVTRHLVDRDARGIFQVVGPDFLDRMTLSEKICEAFDLDAGLLEPMLTAELGQKAPRPLKVRMSTATIDALIDEPIRSVDNGLEALAEWWFNEQ